MEQWLNNILRADIRSIYLYIELAERAPTLTILYSLFTCSLSTKINFPGGILNESPKNLVWLPPTLMAQTENEKAQFKTGFY